MKKQLLPLYPREKAVLDYVKSYIASNGYPPTDREIGVHIGRTRANAHQIIKALKRKGYLVIAEQRYRNIVIKDRA